MTSSDSVIPLQSFQTFGDLLKYLRRRARLTQRDLCIAVGYSEAQISRLEKNLRPPELATLMALFIPALFLEDEPETITRLMELAAQARGETLPKSGQITFSRSVQHEVSEIIQSDSLALNNLPLPLTSFIGRQAEIAELSKLLLGVDPVRLVTLTGPGGIGKTRLALETAAGISHLHPDGIWFVDLTALSAPELVPQTIASTLGIVQTGGQPIDESIIAALRTKQILLVLDNCEHLVHSAAQSAEKILRSCANVQILATSRESLNIAGEANFRVPPLSLPQDKDSGTEIVIRHESVQLFIERARNVLSSLEVNDSEAATIARICRRLDGMPLAIELAAARINLLSLNQIESRLQDRFRLLTGGQTTVYRHQTLRATIEWSHDLLSESEQILFRRLSVFVGGWTLDSANAICAEHGNDILDLLAQLVNKSLVVVERQPDSMVRYTMLETISEFAHKKLQEIGETEKLRTGHFDYFLRTAEQAEPRLFAEESSIDWAEAEIDNLRAALAWALERGTTGFPSEERTRQGLELMAYVWPLWLYRGYFAEGSQWMKQLLAAHTSPTLARARALLLAADFARGHGDYTGQITLIQESLTLARKLGDKKRIAWALMEMGAIERDLHHYPEAIPLQTESLKIFQELNEDLWICRLCFYLAETHIANGNLEDAKPYLVQGMEICRAANDKWQIASGLEGLGNLERLEGHFLKAREHYSESLNLRVSVTDRVGITYLLQAFAQLGAAQGYFDRAAVLWGAAETLHQSVGFLPTPLQVQLYTSLISTTRGHLGEKTFAESWDRGRAMKMQEAVVFALKIE